MTLDDLGDSSEQFNSAAGTLWSKFVDLEYQEVQRGVNLMVDATNNQNSKYLESWKNVVLEQTAPNLDISCVDYRWFYYDYSEGFWHCTCGFAKIALNNALQGQLECKHFLEQNWIGTIQQLARSEYPNPAVIGFLVEQTVIAKIQKDGLQITVLKVAELTPASVLMGAQPGGTGEVQELAKPNAPELTESDVKSQSQRITRSQANKKIKKTNAKPPSTKKIEEDKKRPRETEPDQNAQSAKKPRETEPENEAQSAKKQISNPPEDKSGSKKPQENQHGRVKQNYNKVDTSEETIEEDTKRLRETGSEQDEAQNTKKQKIAQEADIELKILEIDLHIRSGLKVVRFNDKSLGRQLQNEESVLYVPEVFNYRDVDAILIYKGPVEPKIRSMSISFNF